MLIKVGHIDPNDGPVVTEVRLSDEVNEAGEYVCSYVVGTNAQEIKNHLFDNPGLVTHLPGNTAILDTVNPIRDRIQGKTTWVSVEPEGRSSEVSDDYERFLSEFLVCPRSMPVDVEETHWTLHQGEVFAPGDAPIEGN